jgi:hypothetical protein
MVPSNASRVTQVFIKAETYVCKTHVFARTAMHQQGLIVLPITSKCALAAMTAFISWQEDAKKMFALARTELLELLRLALRMATHFAPRVMIRFS